MADDLISRQAAIDELWKALFEYEDKTEKQFQESEDLDLRDWMVHRIFVQNMSDIDRQTILNLPSVNTSDRKVGEWIDDGDPATWVCSTCGYRVARYNNTNYCPNCGARMKGGN